jgi:membrane protease YdiL (CAAX protease family)
MTATDRQPDRGMSASKGTAVLHVVVYCLVFVLIWLVLPAVDDAVAILAPAWVGTVVQAVFYLGAVVAVTWFFCRFLNRDSLVSIGLHGQRWGRNLFLGLGVGALLIALIFVVYIAAGWLTVEGISPQLQDFFAVALFWIASSTVEEITTRGYIMQRLSPSWGVPVAIGVSSVIFTLPHALNPDVNLLALGNTFLVGVFFAFGFLVMRSLWFPIGLHIAWNLAEIGLGFPDSGYLEPGIVRSTVHGPSLLMGGAYGPEAGLLVTGILLLSITIMILLRPQAALAGRERKSVSSQ